MNEADDRLAAARDAFARHDWAGARRRFVAARQIDPGALAASDVAALAECAWWQGDIDECLAGYEEAYREYLSGDDPQPRSAGMLAMEVAFFWLLRGEQSIGSGWLNRAHRLLEDDPASLEHAYLRSMGIDEALASARYTDAIALARDVLVTAERFGDDTLTALCLVGEGIATIKQGHVARGMAILDEAMLPVVAGRVAPAYAGNIYCQLMSVCHELADVRRAREWTDTTAKWCARFTNAVMFVGICRVHRAQLMHMSGDWNQAEDEALRLCDELSEMNVVAVAEGFYELGEVRRLRGDFDGAAEAYRHAQELGRDPQPGSALLSLAQGDIARSAREIRGALRRASDDRLARARLWEAQVEIALTAGDVDTARGASDALSAIASDYGSSGLVAAAVHARGAVALASGRHEDALTELGRARQCWQEIGAPYEVARVRVLLARTYQAIGDLDAARRELDAAGAAFERLGAVRESETLSRLRSASTRPGGLTAREIDVLRLVAEGRTNRQVAESLFLSEKTVARHLSNIFTKLAVSSRTAAAAFAFEHGLATPPRG